VTHDLDIIRRRIQTFEFEKLFNQLGWDRHHGQLIIPVDGNEFVLGAVAHKKGFQVFECRIPVGEPFPLSATCNRIQRQVAKSAHENIIVFTNEEQTRQSWKWAKREQGRILKSRGSDFYKGHSGEALAQRLLHLAVTLDEEEEISLVDITQRVRATFDVDRVTKRFYERFKKEHTAFLKFVEGIKERTNREWYGSLMLNRLMFVYFIQKKGFLAGDRDYLRTRLEATKQVKGRDKFHTFYRYFLLRLFHEGFGQRETNRAADLEELLGQVPYLNGGLFDVHELEREYPKIQIADKAFEKLFDFFDQYQWHLDDRPLRKDTEINPDVLGYIFEKYINQKQMGAYYTKEDITEYISKNTIVPYLFDATEKRCAVAFQPDSEVWQLLRDDPDRYIYDAVGHGIFADIHTGQQLDKPVPLPKEIAAGVDDVSKRDQWNKAASPDMALPTETWREHVGRRQRCEELRKKLRAGEIKSINTLVTYNLNICQFAQDVINNCEGSDLLRSFYHVIAGRIPQRSSETFQSGISILDPTCGSGAFIFAALNILQPLYEGCLERMQAFVAESDADVLKTPEEELGELIACDESKWLEFKATARYDVNTAQNIGKLEKAKQNEILRKLDKDRQRDILKAVSAMANTEGGDLLIGLRDEDKSGFGIEHDYEFFDKKKRNRDAYELWLTNLFVENFGRTVSQCFHISFAKRDGVDICRIAIDPAPEPAYLKDGNSKKLYIRMGNQSRDLDVDEIFKYHKKRFEGPAPPKRNSPPPATAKNAGKAKHKAFRHILQEVGNHPNRGYFILKSIIINNLFGVDIMPEAVEICKLRLFLKLVSQIENIGNLEPLPDIDFNIRAGNTLVGFVLLDQIRQAAERDQSGQGRIVFGDVDDEIRRIEEEADIVERKFKMFRQQQTQLGGAVTAEDKADLRKCLLKLTDQLDEYAAKEYGVDPKKTKSYRDWSTSYQPFHWFAEFYGIMSDGGFDVIVGNPPYVEWKKINSYDVTAGGYRTLNCGNIYTAICERCYDLLNSRGLFGMIVPVSSVSTGRMSALRQDWAERKVSTHVSLYSGDAHPSVLFQGVKFRLCILLQSFGHGSSRVWSTHFYRWWPTGRQHLFPLVNYVPVASDNPRLGLIPKVASPIHADVLDKMCAVSASIGDSEVKQSDKSVYCHRIVAHFVKAFDFVPFFKNERDGVKKSEDYKVFSFANAAQRDAVSALLNSNLVYCWFVTYSDVYHFGRDLILDFPCDVPRLADEYGSELKSANKRLMKKLKKDSVRRRIPYRTTGLVEYDEFYPRKAKAEIDEIDKIVGEFYGLTSEELDFVINYDVKFRLEDDDD
jgi:hypothetical protein